MQWVLLHLQRESVHMRFSYWRVRGLSQSVVFWHQLVLANSCLSTSLMIHSFAEYRDDIPEPDIRTTTRREDIAVIRLDNGVSQ
jgi:hypothetical protein